MTRGRRKRSAIGVLLGLLMSASVAFALDPRGAWSASGGGGVIPVPPWGLKPPGAWQRLTAAWRRTDVRALLETL